MAKLPIKDNPTLNLQMEALTTSTPAHADRFNERYQQLLENDKALQVDAKIYEDDKNGAKIRLGMENGHLYYVQLPSEEADDTGEQRIALYDNGIRYKITK